MKKRKSPDTKKGSLPAADSTKHKPKETKKSRNAKCEQKQKRIKPVVASTKKKVSDEKSSKKKNNNVKSEQTAEDTSSYKAAVKHCEQEFYRSLSEDHQICTRLRFAGEARSAILKDVEDFAFGAFPELTLLFNEPVLCARNIDIYASLVASRVVVQSHNDDGGTTHNGGGVDTTQLDSIAATISKMRREPAPLKISAFSGTHTAVGASISPSNELPISFADVAFLLCRTPGDPKLQAVYGSIARHCKEALVVVWRTPINKHAFTTVDDRVAAVSALFGIGVWARAKLVQDSYETVHYTDMAAEAACSLWAHLQEKTHGITGLDDGFGNTKRIPASALVSPSPSLHERKKNKSGVLSKQVAGELAARLFSTLSSVNGVATLVWNAEWASRDLWDIYAHLQVCRRDQAKMALITGSDWLVLPSKFDGGQGWSVTLDLPFRCSFDTTIRYIPSKIADAPKLYPNPGSSNCRLMLIDNYSGQKDAQYCYVHLIPTRDVEARARVSLILQCMVHTDGKTADMVKYERECGIAHATARTPSSDASEGGEDSTVALARRFADPLTNVPGPRNRDTVVDDAVLLRKLATACGIPQAAIQSTAEAVMAFMNNHNRKCIVSILRHRHETEMKFSADEFVSLESLFSLHLSSPRSHALQPWITTFAFLSSSDMASALTNTPLLCMVADYAFEAWKEETVVRAYPASS